MGGWSSILIDMNLACRWKRCCSAPTSDPLSRAEGRRGRGRGIRVCLTRCARNGCFNRENDYSPMDFRGTLFPDNPISWNILKWTRLKLRSKNWPKNRYGIGVSWLQMFLGGFPDSQLNWIVKPSLLLWDVLVSSLRISGLTFMEEIGVLGGSLVMKHGKPKSPIYLLGCFLPLNLHLIIECSWIFHEFSIVIPLNAQPCLCKRIIWVPLKGLFTISTY